MSLNSKQKGKRGELLWAKVCQEHGFEEVRRTAQFCGKTGQAADCIGLPHIHQEVKFVQALNIGKAMEQAVRDSKAEGKGNMPIVAHKKNGKEWLVTMKADDFFQLYKGYLFMQGDM